MTGFAAECQEPIPDGENTQRHTHLVPGLKSTCKRMADIWEKYVKARGSTTSSFVSQPWGRVGAFSLKPAVFALHENLCASTGRVCQFQSCTDCGILSGNLALEGVVICVQFRRLKLGKMFVRLASGRKPGSLPVDKQNVLTLRSSYAAFHSWRTNGNQTVKRAPLPKTKSMSNPPPCNSKIFSASGIPSPAPKPW